MNTELWRYLFFLLGKDWTQLKTWEQKHATYFEETLGRKLWNRAD